MSTQAPVSTEVAAVAAPSRRMPRPIVAYVRIVEAIGRKVGGVAMAITFLLLGILAYSVLSRLFTGAPPIWGVEMAQFTMAAYYLLGGAFSEQDGQHVRMDLFYSRLSPRGKVIMDCITDPLVIFYLAYLFWGAWDSTRWAIAYNQISFSAWAPVLWPIKVIMTVGIGIMLLQMIAVFFKDLAKALGRSME